MKTVMTVVAVFAIAVTGAVLTAIGRQEWATLLWAVLLGLAVATTIVRVIRRRRIPVGDAVARAGQAQSDILTGVTYTGPRVVSPPLQQATGLVVDPDPRRELPPPRARRDGVAEQ